jgi:hypothetical protein
MKILPVQQFTWKQIAHHAKGEWKVREADEPVGIEGDKGLIASNEAKKHGIATQFDPIDPTGETLVVQYEVRRSALNFFINPNMSTTQTKHTFQ